MLTGQGCERTASQGHREDIRSRIDGWVLTASHAAWQKKKKKKAARSVFRYLNFSKPELHYLEVETAIRQLAGS